MADGSDDQQGQQGQPGDGQQGQQGQQGQNPGEGQQGQQGNWYDDLPEASRSVLEHKGWLKDNPVDALNSVTESYQNLERMRGMPADRLVELPGEDAGDDAWKEVFRKLGAPDSPDGYEIPVPENLGENALADKAKNWFHEAGITPKQAEIISNRWNEEMTSLVEGQQAETQAKRTADVDALKKDWGDAFEKRVNQSAGVMESLGFSEQDVEAMRNAIGTKRMTEMFFDISTKVGEDSFQSGEGSQTMSGGMTPEQAKAEINRLQADPSFRKQLMDNRDPSHKDAVAKRERLYQIAYPQ